MRRFTATEKGIFALAALLTGCGAWSALFPSEASVVNLGYGWRVHFSTWVQHISKSDARIYGILACVAGTSLAGLVLYRGRK